MSVIKELHSQNIDYVKLVNSGIYTPGTGMIDPGGFLFKELKEVITYCKSLRLPVYCHANGDKTIREALLAGAKGIVHGFFITERTMDLMAEKETLFIPTINALKSLTAICKNQEETDRVSRAVEEHMKKVEYSSGLGIKVLPGSDSGPSFIPYGKACIEELELLREAGLSYKKILRRSTLSKIEPMSKANFIILKDFKAHKVYMEGELCSE